MPQRLPTKDDTHWCGGWPMTLKRIRYFAKKWKGQPGNSVPFSLHAIKLLLAIIDGDLDPPGEPHDAPWMEGVEPKDYSEWLHGYRATHNKMPPPKEYTEPDLKLHNAIEDAGPVDEIVPDGFDWEAAPPINSVELNIPEDREDHTQAAVELDEDLERGLDGFF